MTDNSSCFKYKQLEERGYEILGDVTGFSETKTLKFGKTKFSNFTMKNLKTFITRNSNVVKFEAVSFKLSNFLLKKKIY